MLCSSSLIDIPALYTQKHPRLCSECVQHHIQAVVSVSNLVCYFNGTQSEAVCELSAHSEDSVERHLSIGCSIAATKWQRIDQI